VLVYGVAPVSVRDAQEPERVRCWQFELLLLHLGLSTRPVFCCESTAATGAAWQEKNRSNDRC
jgi:hypothetical protein